MAAICPTLLTRGFCLDASCRLQHDTSNFCFTCNLALNTAATYNQHIQSPTHAQAESASRWLKCIPCNQYYIRNTPTQTSHESSGGHLEKIGTHSTTSTNPPVVGIAAPPNFTRCDACSCPVASSKFGQHCRTQAHIDHQRIFDYRNALLQTQANQRGIEVSGPEDGLDLGTRPPTLASANSAPLTVWVSRVGSGSVSLTHVRTSSSLGVRPGFQLCFTFTTVPMPIVITPQSSVAIQVHFNPRGQRGHFEDRLELVFRESNGGSFVITRPLKATVANEDVLSLAPVEPYRRPRRARGRRNEIEVVSGGEKPLSSVKYVRALKFALMPEEMKKILQEGNVEDQTVSFRTTFMPEVLELETFQRYWTSLVHAEHFQAILDLEGFNMDDVNIAKVDRLYSLMIPGLAENRPSVMVGDRIKLHPHSTEEGVWFEGFVHNVLMASVLISFSRSFPYSPGALYDVKFVLNPVPFHRMLHAIQTTPKRPNLLFPTLEDINASATPTRSGGEVDLDLYNKNIDSNVEQLQAVKRVLQLPPGSPPFIVFGPPGTGKTVTIVECICQLLNDRSNTRILACAPSNSAADLIAQRLIDLRGLQTTDLFRMNAIWRPMKNFPPDLLEYSLRTGGHFNVPVLDTLNSYQVIVATCSSAALLYSFGVDQGAFTHIFVDEAGQASEAEVMIPILTMAGPTTNVVLSGDPRQLGPVVRSPIARQLGMQTSYLQRLMASPAYDEGTMRGISVAKILQNFRSHSAILSFPNQEFYGNELIPCAPKNVSDVLLGWNRLGTAGFPIVFEAVTGEDMREATSPSYFNPHEASVVKEYVQGLLPFISSAKRIGIVTPYRAQVKKIRKLLDDAEITGVDIGSVENFQGQERQVIIVSTVRSNRDLISYDLKHTLGFVASAQRLNVAVTRAQALLIVVGDPQVLGLDMLWRRFMYYIYKSGGWKGAPFPWDPDASPEEASATSELAEQELIELLRRTNLHGSNTSPGNPDELDHVGGSGN